MHLLSCVESSRLYCCLVNKYQNEKRLAATKAVIVIEKINLYELVVRKSEGKRPLGSVVLLDGRMTIKWILRKYSVTVWFRLMWLRTRIYYGIL